MENASQPCVTRNCGVLLSIACVMNACGCPAVDSSSINTPTLNNTRRSAVTLIISGDTAGWIMPCGCTSNQSGGMLRRGTYLAQQRDGGETLYVDVGGSAAGTSPYQLEKFKAILTAETLAGVAAHNLGGSEIAFGAEVLNEVASETEIPFVSCNVSDRSQHLLADGVRIIDRGGQRILITGVVSPSFFGPGIIVTEPAAALLDVISKHHGKYDRMIVLAYLPEKELTELAQNLPEADAIIGGPTGQSLSPRQVGPVLLASATNKGKFLAELHLPSDIAEVMSAQIVEMSPEFADEPDQQRNLDNFRAMLARRDFTAQESDLLEETVVSSSNHSSLDTVAGTQSCLECHAETCEHWETTGHAHAWARLISEGAQFDPYCQQCHTTGYGWKDGFQAVALSEERVNVGCESCHGPSQQHALSEGRTPFDAAGRCINCHDPENSPKFEYGTYWEQVRHE